MSSLRSSTSGKTGPRSIWEQIRESFWAPPSISCPKCASTAVEYYDPLFFSPIRTFCGRRRFRCTKCRFIWRPSRSGKSIWEQIRNRYEL